MTASEFRCALGVALATLAGCGRDAPPTNGPSSAGENPSPVPRGSGRRETERARLTEVLKADHARVADEIKARDEQLARLQTTAVALMTKAAADHVRLWTEVLDDAKKTTKAAAPDRPAVYSTFAALVRFAGLEGNPDLHRDARTMTSGAFDYRFFVPDTRASWALGDEDGDVELRREFVLVFASPTAEWWELGAATCLVGTPGQSVLARSFSTRADAESWRPAAIGACSDRGAYWRLLTTAGWTAYGQHGETK